MNRQRRRPQNKNINGLKDATRSFHSLSRLPWSYYFIGYSGRHLLVIREALEMERQSKRESPRQTLDIVYDLFLTLIFHSAAECRLALECLIECVLIMLEISIESRSYWPTNQTHIWRTGQHTWPLTRVNPQKPAARIGASLISIILFCKIWVKLFEYIHQVPNKSNKI